MGEKSKLGWMIRLVKHAIWADSLYFLYPLSLSISKFLAPCQPTYDPLHRHFGLVLIFLQDPL
jgi:hypothetical protein